MESEINRQIWKWENVNPDDPDQDNGTKLLHCHWSLTDPIVTAPLGDCRGHVFTTAYYQCSFGDYGFFRHSALHLSQYEHAVRRLQRPWFRGPPSKDVQSMRRGRLSSDFGLTSEGIGKVNQVESVTVVDDCLHYPSSEAVLLWMVVRY
ncbi:hypothetical protein TNCV_4969071 [Trichonephila clavipes]|nr:hypothetical protein TNCV_4969071 [Trichonephila clavipes]